MYQGTAANQPTLTSSGWSFDGTDYVSEVPLAQGSGATIEVSTYSGQAMLRMSAVYLPDYEGKKIVIAYSGVTLQGYIYAQHAADEVLSLVTDVEAGKLYKDSITGNYFTVPTVTDVPQAEANALVKFFALTNGWSWTNKTNWLQTSTVGNWFGIIVSGGHVTSITSSGNNASGNISTFDPSVFTGLTSLNLSGASFTGDMSGVTYPTGLTSLTLSGASFTGDISGVTYPTGLTYLYLNGNSFTGDMSGVTYPTGLTYLYLIGSSFTGDMSGVTYPTGLTYLYLLGSSFTGDMSGVTYPIGLTYLYLNGSSFTGDMSGVTYPTGLTYLYLIGSSFSGAPDMSTCVGIRTFNYQSNNLPQVDVDATLLGIYTNRALFTYATPTLNIGGTNSAPSGIYQDGDPPTTGNEYKYELVNDPEVEGFNKWTITAN